MSVIKIDKREPEKLVKKAVKFFEGADVDWKYESKRIIIPSGIYIPDFELTPNKFIEVKGFLDEYSCNKLMEFEEAYPDIELIYVERETYEYLKKEYGDKVGWEN